MKKLALFAVCVLGCIAAYSAGLDFETAALAVAPFALIGEVKFESFGDYLKSINLEDLTGKEEGANEADLHAFMVAKLQYEKGELEAMVKELGESKADVKKLEFLKDTIRTQGTAITALQKNLLSGSQVHELNNSVKSVLLENMENLKAHKEGRAENFKFTLKATMTITDAVTGGNMPQADRLEGINDIVERTAVTYSIIPKYDTAANVIQWVYEANQGGTIDGTAEGAAKDEIDNGFVIESVNLKKRAAYFKVSTEMLDDISFMEAWLRNKLITRLFLDVDNQVLNGDDTGQNLNGVINQSTAWAAGSFAGTVDNANEVDVLTVGLNQVKLANHGLGRVAIMMNPTDVTNLKLVKLSTTDKRYVDRLIQVAGSLNLDGVPIIENNNMPVGEFLIADFSLALVGQKSGIMVDIGLDGNDFTNNVRTILAEWRGQVVIENNYRTAFVTGAFASSKSALETP